MEDKTPLYLMLIVGMVALVAVVYMFAGTGKSDRNYNPDYGGNAITGNAVSENIEPVSFKGFGRFVVGVALIGACIYMYRKVE